MRSEEELFYEDVNRYLRLKENPKDIKAGGVVRKLRRKIRRTAKKLNIEYDV